MAKMTDQYLANNRKYAAGEALHKPAHPGKQPINPAKHVAVLACMDARIDVEDLLGLQTGDAHIIRNAGGVATDDAIRNLIISHHLLDTNEIILIHHTRCGMLAFTDDLLKAGLEGDPAAEKLLGQSRAARSARRHPRSSTRSGARSRRSMPRAATSRWSGCSGTCAEACRRSSTIRGSRRAAPTR
jgi:carbonic anhydrase